MFRKRRTNLKLVCANHNQTRYFFSDYRITTKHLVYYQDQDITACELLKAGSTPTSKIFDFMSMLEKYSSSFDIGWEEYSQRQKHPSMKNIQI